MSERLRELLEKGRDWERRSTVIPGVFVIKLPESRGRPASLAVEVNPLDSLGRPTKKRPLLIRSLEELKAFRELLNNEKLEKLLKMIERVNPTTSKEEGEEEVIDV